MSNKLGRDTNSVVNWMYGNSKSPEPEVGMGATMLMWTDRHAMTIHKVDLTGAVKKIWVSADKATRIDKNGMSESQNYDYTNENQNNPERWILCTLRKDGRWHIGNSLKGTCVAVGFRREYYDYSF
jgi:hypothetical protein